MDEVPWISAFLGLIFKNIQTSVTGTTEKCDGIGVLLVLALDGRLGWTGEDSFGTGESIPGQTGALNPGAPSTFFIIVLEKDLYILK